MCCDHAWRSLPFSQYVLLFLHMCSKSGLGSKDPAWCALDIYWSFVYMNLRFPCFFLSFQRPNFAGYSIDVCARVRSLACLRSARAPHKPNILYSILQAWRAAVLPTSLPSPLLSSRAPLQFFSESDFCCKHEKPRSNVFSGSKGLPAE